MFLKMSGFARASMCVGMLASAAMLASCGGGDPEQTFFADRVISLGDEMSVINADQTKFSVNGLKAGSTTVFDCSVNPLWVQQVAALYGLVFPQCPFIGTTTVTSPVSRIYAQDGATVASLDAQITQQLNNGGFTSGDMVTILVGANDVIAEFAKYPNTGEAQLLANLDAAGTLLAQQVNRISGTGARVLISTIPDMGLTPFAGDRSAGSTNSNPALLSRLSARFNDAMLANISNDGHKIGLIQLDEYLQANDAAAKFGQGNFNNTTQASCAVALPNCSTSTLVTAAVNSVWMWADARHLSASAQANLGSLATTRAVNNPF
jgi:lysophospholipase L1-like esterase